MAKAVWNGKVIAESDTYETVEGNVYFPESTVKREYLRSSSTTSTCPWKGLARYYSLLVDGQENQDAALDVLRRERAQLISLTPVRISLEDYFVEQLSGEKTAMSADLAVPLRN